MGDGYPSILFLDYGNIVPVHIQDIRPYPPEFRFPVVTSELELIGKFSALNKAFNIIITFSNPKGLPTNLSDKQLIRLEEYFGVGTFVECDEVILNNDANNYSVRFDILKSILA